MDGTPDKTPIGYRCNFCVEVHPTLRAICNHLRKHVQYGEAKEGHVKVRTSIVTSRAFKKRECWIKICDFDIYRFLICLGHLIRFVHNIQIQTFFPEVASLLFLIASVFKGSFDPFFLPLKCLVCLFGWVNLYSLTAHIMKWTNRASIEEETGKMDECGIMTFP